MIPSRLGEGSKDQRQKGKPFFPTLIPFYHGSTVNAFGFKVVRTGDEGGEKNLSCPPENLKGGGAPTKLRFLKDQLLRRGGKGRSSGR